MTKNIEKYLLNPAAYFAEPDMVLNHPDFTNTQKIEILEHWLYDASDLAVAEEEGMGGGEVQTSLRQLHKALNHLRECDEKDHHHGVTTKHGC